MTPDLEKAIDGAEIFHIYAYYDGPLIFTLKSVDDEKYFYSFFADCTQKYAKHVHLPIAKEQLDALEMGKISVWGLVKGKTAYSEYYDFATETKRFVEEPVLDNELPLNDLLCSYDAEQDQGDVRLVGES